MGQAGIWPRLHARGVGLVAGERSSAGIRYFCLFLATMNIPTSPNKTPRVIKRTPSPTNQPKGLFGLWSGVFTDMGFKTVFGLCSGWAASVIVTNEGMMTASIHSAKTFLRKDSCASQAARPSVLQRGLT